MSAAATKPAIYLAFGMFLGFLLGLVVMIAVQSVRIAGASGPEKRLRLLPCREVLAVTISNR